MYKIFCSVMMLALSAGAATAADLGARGSTKDGGTYDALAPVVTPTDYGSSWGGFYIMGGVGRSSTAHDVQGRTDDSTAKFLSDTTYLNKPVYVQTTGTVTTGTVTTTCTATAPCYVTGKPAAAETYTTLPAGSVASTLPTGATLPAGSTSTAARGDGVIRGDLGDKVLANAGSAVGYTIDTSSLFSYDGTATGMAGTLGLGYDAQLGKMVLGVMADYQFRTAKTTIANVDVKQSDAVFLGARLGFLPAHQMMVYALGGYTWLNHSGLANNIQTAYPSLGADGVTTTYGDGSYGGPTLGLGAEMPVTKGIYLGVEGRHTWLGKETVATSKFNYGDVYYHQSTTTVTDEPSDWYVGVNLKLKLNHDSVGSLK